MFRQAKAIVKSLWGIALFLYVVIGLVTYFSDRISVSNFLAISFVVTLVAILLAYYNWVAMRAGILFVVMTVVLSAGIMIGKHPAVKSSEFQAVFLTSGQVYFGHLHNAYTNSPTLTDVYYLRSNQQNPQNNTNVTSSDQLSLVKLGNEIHGPEDVMSLKPDQVLFWENLKDNGKVVTAIHQNEQKK